ncbi:MAG: hypothetical protein ABL906_05430 [Sideroxydans sp.]
MKKSILQCSSGDASNSLFALLVTHGFDATLAFLCTLFVFTDD